MDSGPSQFINEIDEEHLLFLYDRKRSMAIEDEDQSCWNEGYSSSRYGRSAGFRSSAGYGSRQGSSSGNGRAGVPNSTGFVRSQNGSR